MRVSLFHIYSNNLPPSTCMVHYMAFQFQLCNGTRNCLRMHTVLITVYINPPEPHSYRNSILQSYRKISVEYIVMNVIPQAQPINFDDDMEVSVKERFQPQETKINVGNGITKRPVGGTKKDFFVRNAEEPKAPPKAPPKVVEQPAAEASQPPQQPVEPQAKAKKPKRKCTPAQLAALARAREKRNAKMAEKRQIKKDLQKEDPKFQEKQAKQQNYVKTREQWNELKEQKRVRKRQEQKQLFEEMFAEKEKVRLAEKAKRQEEKAKAKAQRRQEKLELYKKWEQMGRINTGSSVPKPQATPAPKAEPKKEKRKQVRFENGRLVSYWE